MPSAIASTITSGSCSKARASAPGSSPRDLDLRDPHRRAQPRRLDEHRQAERSSAAGVALADRRVVHLRQPGARHQLLEQRPCPSHTAEAITPGAHVGHVEQLEQPLHGAVLAERAVQHREDHVGARAGRRPGSSATGSPSRDQRPSRAMRTSTGSCPPSASPRAPPPRTPARPRARSSARRRGRRPSRRAPASRLSGAARCSRPPRTCRLRSPPSCPRRPRRRRRPLLDHLPSCASSVDRALALHRH